MAAFLYPRNGETVKALWHGALGVLALGALAYNAAAWGHRRVPHLLRNTCIYGALVGLEIVQVRRHWRHR